MGEALTLCSCFSFCLRVFPFLLPSAILTLLLWSVSATPRMMWLVYCTHQCFLMSLSILKIEMNCLFNLGLQCIKSSRPILTCTNLTSSLVLLFFTQRCHDLRLSYFCFCMDWYSVNLRSYFTLLFDAPNADFAVDQPIFQFLLPSVQGSAMFLLF